MTITGVAGRDGSPSERLTIAGGWEVIEWSIDQWTDDGRDKDAADTASDLTSGVYGSVAAGIVLVGWSKLDLPLTRTTREEAAQWLVDRRAARHS